MRAVGYFLSLIFLETSGSLLRSFCGFVSCSSAFCFSQQPSFYSSHIPCLELAGSDPYDILLEKELCQLFVVLIGEHCVSSALGDCELFAPFAKARKQFRLGHPRASQEISVAAAAFAIKHLSKLRKSYLIGHTTIEQ